MKTFKVEVNVSNFPLDGCVTVAVQIEAPSAMAASHAVKTMFGHNSSINKVGELVEPAIVKHYMGDITISTLDFKIMIESLRALSELLVRAKQSRHFDQDFVNMINYQILEANRILERYKFV